MSPIPAGRPADRRSPRFLIVEDDGVTRQQFADILTAAGCTVLQAHDTRTALEQLAEAEVCAILLDWHLPDVGGLDFIRAIRALHQHQHVPIVVITGDYFLDETLPRQLEELEAQIRFKPIWGDELVQLARQLVESRGDDCRRPE